MELLVSFCALAVLAGLFIYAIPLAVQTRGAAGSSPYG
jgi:hypothetical protein